MGGRKGEQPSVEKAATNSVVLKEDARSGGKDIGRDSGRKTNARSLSSQEDISRLLPLAPSSVSLGERIPASTEPGNKKALSSDVRAVKNLPAISNSVNAAAAPTADSLSSAVRSNLDRLRRFYNRYGVSEDNRVRIAEIMVAEREPARESAMDFLGANQANDLSAIQETGAKLIERQQSVFAKIAELVGPEIAAKIIEARHSLYFHIAIVNDFVKRTAEAGEPVSVETADRVAIALFQQNIYVPLDPDLPPRMISSDRLNRMVAQDEDAIHVTAALLTPRQLQQLKDMMDARYKKYFIVK
jgi:hypothetical protein